VFWTKNINEEPKPDDGRRILVDRPSTQMPNSAEEARFDQWMKDVLPSQELLNWFADVAERWTEFRERYWAELDAKPELIEHLVRLGSEQEVTLLYVCGSRDRNTAICLRDYLYRNTTHKHVQTSGDKP
jgi:uncharacterized protein YeaO (DUF488 family)